MELQKTGEMCTEMRILTNVLSYRHLDRFAQPGVTVRTVRPAVGLRAYNRSLTR